MRVLTKVLGLTFQAKMLRVGVLIFGMLYTLSSQALAQLNSSILHDDNKFTELSVYQDHQVGMVIINTKDDPQIITAYADNSCAIHGQLSIVKTSISDPESFSYLQDCISANSVDDVVLKKDGNDNVYVAYIENGSNNQIHLKWLKNGEDKFIDFPYSEQLTGKNPLHINLAINEITNKPVIVYTAQDGKAIYLYVLKYDDYVEDETPGFTLYTPGQQGVNLQVNNFSHPRIAYNSLGDLYIAYTGKEIGLVELDSNNKWSYINSVHDLNLNKIIQNYSGFYSNSFDMTIKNDILYLAGLNNFNVVLCFSYNTTTKSNQTFSQLFKLETLNKEDVSNLRLLFESNDNYYLSMVTKDYAYSYSNAYFSNPSVAKPIDYYKDTSGSSIAIGAVLNDGFLNNEESTIGYILKKSPGYKMNRIIKNG